MQLDPDLAQRVDELLRTDRRLIAAAALVGRVAVVVSEPKPERVRKSTAKRAPPRPGEQPSTAPAIEPEVEEAKPAHAPWLKVARAGKVSDALRAVLGDRVLVVVTVDGGLWGKLRVEDQQRALVLALRPVRHEEREDGSDKVAREAPPLQCHADTADDLSHLVAALGVDGAEGAAAVSAAERLGAPEDGDNEDEEVVSKAWAHALLRDLRTFIVDELDGNLDAPGVNLGARLRGAFGEDM